MAITLDEAVIKLGVQTDLKAIKEFQSALEGVITKATATIGSILGLGFSIEQILTSTVDSARGFQLFSTTTGLSAQELQKWDMVARRAGVSAGIMAKTVEQISAKIPGLAILGEGAEGLKLFESLTRYYFKGLNPYMKPFEFLTQIREGLKHLEKMYPGQNLQPTKTMLLQKIGIDPAMLLLLDATDEKFKQIAKDSELVMTQSQVERAMEYNAQIEEMRDNFKHTSEEFSMSFAPILDKLTKGLMIIMQGWEKIFQYLRIGADLVMLATGDPKSIEDIRKMFKEFGGLPQHQTSAEQVEAAYRNRMGDDLYKKIIANNYSRSETLNKSSSINQSLNAKIEVNSSAANPLEVAKEVKSSFEDEVNRAHALIGNFFK